MSTPAEQFAEFAEKALAALSDAPLPAHDTDNDLMRLDDLAAALNKENDQ